MTITAFILLATVGFSSLGGVLDKYALVSYGEVKTSAPARIPSGCAEFDVDLPHLHDGPVVRAVDYGLSEAGTDNAAAINRALAAAKRLGAVRLELAPGTYRCHDSRGIVVDGFSDFTIEGCGAVLVFCRPPRIRPSVRQYDLDSDGGNLLIRNCTRVAVRRVSMDWDWAVDPLADFARVVARHVDEKDDASYVDLQLTDLERHPKYPAPVPVQIVGQMREDRTNIDGNGWGCGVGYAEGHFGSKNAWIAPNVLRVWPCVRQPDAFESPWYDKLFSSARNRRETAALRAGALVRIVHCYYGQNAVNMISNVHLTLEDFHIWACRGMGFNVQGAQHHWVLRRCSVALPTHLKGRRAITATADANHIVQSQGWCRFEDCAWSLHLDDMNNFHDRMTVGVKDGERAIRLVNVRGNGYFQAQPGDRIGLREADYASVGWTGRLVCIEGETLVFDRPVPKERLECFQLFKADYATDNIIIRNCRFDDGFGRNLLQAHNLTIENCSFHRTTGAPICLMAEWTYNAWSEGRGVTNAVIRGCTFAENMIQCGAYDGLKADIFSGVRIRADVEGWVAGRKVAAPRPPSDRQAVGDILVEKCRFENPKGLCWHAARGANLIFRDNEIVLSKDDAAALPYHGSVLFEEPHGVSVFGNRLISARSGATAGVYLPK